MVARPRRFRSRQRRRHRQRAARGGGFENQESRSGVEHGGLRWINIEQPGALEQAWLAEHFDFHPLDLEDVRSRNQRPKIDEYEDYLFVVLHFPVYDTAIQRLNAGELDFFLGHDYLVTLPNVELLPVSRLFARCAEDEQLRTQLFSRGSGYLLYHVLDDLFDLFAAVWVLESTGALWRADDEGLPVINRFFQALESPLHVLAPPPPKKIKLDAPQRRILPLSENKVATAFDVIMMLQALLEVGDFTQVPDRAREKHYLFLDDWRRMVWESARLDSWARTRELVLAGPSLEERIPARRFSRTYRKPAPFGAHTHLCRLPA